MLGRIRAAEHTWHLQPRNQMLTLGQVGIRTFTKASRCEMPQICFIPCQPVVVRSHKREGNNADRIVAATCSYLEIVSKNNSLMFTAGTVARTKAPRIVCSLVREARMQFPTSALQVLTLIAMTASIPHGRLARMRMYRAAFNRVDVNREWTLQTCC